MLDAEPVRSNARKAAIPFPAFNAMAFAAGPPTVADNDVGWGVFVPTWAVGLSCQVLPGLSPSGVYDVWHRLKMRWIHAMADTAEMIKFEAVGNGANQPSIGQPVRDLVVMRGPRSASNLSISVRGKAGGPKPTRPQISPGGRNRAILVDLRPKTLFKGKLSPHRILQWFGVMGTGVTAPRPLHYTQTTREDRA